MNTKTKMSIIALVVGAVAFFLSRILWPDAPDMPMPSAGQLPFFMIITAAESLLFGFGISFIIFAWPKIQSMVSEERRAFLLPFIALSWLLLSWWPHDNFHRMNGMNLQGLLYIDYGFHLTLILATLVLARFYYKKLKGDSLLGVK